MDEIGSVRTAAGFSVGDTVMLKGNEKPCHVEEFEIIGIWTDGQLTLAWLRWSCGYGFDQHNINDLVRTNG